MMLVFDVVERCRNFWIL